MKTILRACIRLLCIVAALHAVELSASHHRGGRVGWEYVSQTGAAKTVRAHFQVVFERLPNVPGGTAHGGYPRLNDIIADPLSSSTSGPRTELVIEKVGGPIVARRKYNFEDLYRLRVVAVEEDSIVCEPVDVPEFTFSDNGIYKASLQMHARDGASFDGGEGLFNRYGTSGQITAITEATIDLSAPGQAQPVNSSPRFGTAIASTLEFNANQILTDPSGGFIPGGILNPPTSLPFEVIDPDVSASPQSDIITYRIKNTNLVPNQRGEDSAGVPGLSIASVANRGELTWNPQNISSAERRQTCGVWSVTVVAEDWAWDHPPGSANALPKSSTELEVMIRINEPTSNTPSLQLFDIGLNELLPANDPIHVTIPAGTIGTLANFTFSDADIHAHVTGEVVIGPNNKVFFDPPSVCTTDGGQGRVEFAADLTEIVGTEYSVDIRGRDDDGLITGTRSFIVHIAQPISGTIHIGFQDRSGAPISHERIRADEFYNSMRIIVERTMSSWEYRSNVPLTVSATWEHPLGTPTGFPAGMSIIPNVPISGTTGYTLALIWQPTFAQIGLHRLTITATAPGGESASSAVVLDVSPFQLQIFDANTLVDGFDAEIDAWRPMQAIIDQLPAGATLSFPNLPKGVRVVGNIAYYRPMGGQIGLTEIPIQITGITGAPVYNSTLRINVLKIQPSYWFHQDSSRTVITPDPPYPQPPIERHDHAMANLGQVKHIARMAALAIKDATPGTLITETQADQLIAAIEAATPLGNSNFVPCNQGQLKNLAAPFYQLFNDAGVLFRPDGAPNVVPWSSATTDDAHNAPVNIGQVKTIFSFDPGFLTQYPQP